MKVKTLALIPAKGTSRGMPGKNIAELNGHPVIAYSIAAGRQAAGVDRVIVSTDSNEIRDIALHYGAEVPFLRPAALCADDSRDLEVFVHALDWLREHGETLPDVIVQLRPTSPLRAPNLVDQALELLAADPAADSVRSVCAPGQNPYKMWREAGDGSLAPLLEAHGIAEPYNAPRQRLPKVLWQTGALDAMRRATLLEQHSMTGARIVPLELKLEHSVDIDGPEDLMRAERLLASGTWTRP